jgi:O-antigen ligase
MVAGIVVMVAAAAMYTNMDLLARRMGGAMSEGVLGRLSIWRQTWPLVSDFWPVGAGVGSYQRAMMVYQTSSRLFYISHADNEILQMLAEGGALLALPVAAAIGSVIVIVRRRLQTDRTRMFWIRAGAASSLVAIAVQNMWEMTLRVPANAVLLAICAALAVREAAER